LPKTAGPQLLFEAVGPQPAAVLELLNATCLGANDSDVESNADKKHRKKQEKPMKRHGLFEKRYEKHRENYNYMTW
jgi:hypothetical protein